MSQEDTTIEAGQEPDATNEGGDTAGTQIEDVPTLQRELDEARREAARYRNERNTRDERITTLQGQITAISRALGLESDEPDADALTSELENVRSQLRSERLANRFTRVAAATGADSDLTLAYLSHNGQLAGLDPDADDFEASLTALVEAALKASPKLRADETVSRGGGDFSKGENGGATRTMDDLIRGFVRRT